MKLMESENEYFPHDKIRLIYNGIDSSFIERKKDLSLIPEFKEE